MFTYTLTESDVNFVLPNQNGTGIEMMPDVESRVDVRVTLLTLAVPPSFKNGR